MSDRTEDEIFRYRCQREWEQLDPTANESIRFCGRCQREVHWCTTDAERREHAQAGRCVALEAAGEVEVTLGILLEDPDPEPTESNKSPQPPLDDESNELEIPDDPSPPDES